MLIVARSHRLTAYAQMEIPTKCHDLALKIACDPITEKCVIKECEDCPSLDLEALRDCSEVCFYTWKKKSIMKSS